MTDFTTPREMADALQTVVDDLRAMPNDDLPKIAVQVMFQSVRYDGTPEERMRAVDVLGWHLVGSAGVMLEDGDHYWLPINVRDRNGLSIGVYTNPLPQHRTMVVCNPVAAGYPDLHPGYGWSCTCGSGDTRNPVEDESPVGYMSEDEAQALAYAHVDGQR